MIRKIVKLVLPIFALFLGVMVMVALVKTQPEAEKKSRDDRGVVVEVMTTTSKTRNVVVTAHGEVRAAREVTLAPEVAGRVLLMSTKLRPGGIFDKGEQMLRLDGRDYHLAVHQQRAAVKRAHTSWQVEESRKKIAEREYELMEGKYGMGKADPLALRDPQVKTAKMTYKSAESGLRRAQLNVGRTVLRAPFNALVRHRQVDVGQIVGPGAPVVTLVGIDAFWVQISIPVERLMWMDIPGVDGATRGSRARVWRKVGRDIVEREGEVIQLLGDLDPMGRMARVLVEIKDPLGIHKARAKARGGKSKKNTLKGKNGEPPVIALDAPTIVPKRKKPGQWLFIGGFVQVDIEGRAVEDAIEIPRVALRNGDHVYVMNERKLDLRDSLRDMLFWAPPESMDELATLRTLQIRKVDVVWRKRDSVYVGAGLRTGDLVVTSPLATPIEGLKLRLPHAATASFARKQASSN